MEIGKISIAIARIERIKKILERWQQKKSVSSIERNLVLTQLSALYDELMDFDIEKIPDHIIDEVLQAQPKEEDMAAETTAIENEDEADSVTIDQVPPILIKEEVVESKKIQASSSSAKQEEQTAIRLGDKFVGLQKYLFENFDNQDEMGVARFSAIDDINRAIGINDRFLFIKELFNGDKDLFNKTISTLNSCSSMDDALMYIHENFSWNSDDAAVKQLVLLLYRRFK